MSDPMTNQDVDPADRPEPEMAEAVEAAGVPDEYRAANAGGAMSETVRSRSTDDTDEDDE